MAMTRRGFLRGATGIAVGGALAGCSASRPASSASSADAGLMLHEGAVAQALRELTAARHTAIAELSILAWTMSFTYPDGQHLQWNGPGAIVSTRVGTSPDALAIEPDLLPGWDFSDYFGRAGLTVPSAGSNDGVRVGRTDWGHLASRVTSGQAAAVLDAQGTPLPTLELTAAAGISAALQEVETLAAAGRCYACSLDALDSAADATVGAYLPGDETVTGSPSPQMCLLRTSTQRQEQVLSGAPDSSQHAFPLSAVNVDVALRCAQSLRDAGLTRKLGVWITSSNGSDPTYMVSAASNSSTESRFFDAAGNRTS